MRSGSSTIPRRIISVSEASYIFGRRSVAIRGIGCSREQSRPDTESRCSWRALVLLFSLVASGQIRLRKIDGWRKIATVLRQHTPRAA